jgi:hypothetical protein
MNGWRGTGLIATLRGVALLPMNCGESDEEGSPGMGAGAMVTALALATRTVQARIAAALRRMAPRPTFICRP